VRVLVIEDEGRIAELVSAALREAGFAVDACDCVADGIAALEVTPMTRSSSTLACRMVTGWRFCALPAASGTVCLC
jgi:DNA-binding response OmpR family regulator